MEASKETKTTADVYKMTSEEFEEASEETKMTTEILLKASEKFRKRLTFQK